mgnify:CR=1 FL=1
MVQLVNAYEGDVIQSNLSHNGLIARSGLKSSIYRADRIQMINERMNKMCTLTIGIENFVADEKGFPKFLDEFFKKAIKGFRA